MVSVKRYSWSVSAIDQSPSKNNNTNENVISSEIVVNHEGKCQNGTEPGEACQKNMLYQPVCGSDKETYANIEALNCKNAMVPGYGKSLIQRCSTDGYMQLDMVNFNFVDGGVGSVDVYAIRYPFNKAPILRNM